MQEPRIELLPERTFVGLHTRASFATHRPEVLWRRFGPLRRGIANAIGTGRFSMAVYGPGFFDAFDPHRAFEQWATVEVADAAHVPEGMAVLRAAGLYAVFIHRGPASDGPRTFRYIFGTWLPASRYEVDQRPHFEVMGPGYDPDAEEAEEALWIPVRER
ncbi:MAG: GyrI-like domain-containing protein [Flavobacteriales bacterium]